MAPFIFPHKWSLRESGGETGIRTLDTVTRILPFQGSPIDHSGISPSINVSGGPRRT